MYPPGIDGARFEQVSDEDSTSGRERQRHCSASAAGASSIFLVSCQGCIGFLQRHSFLTRDTGSGAVIAAGAMASGSVSGTSV